MSDKEYEEMRVSGILGVIHRLIMLITLPFRKFWKTVCVVLAVLAVLIAVPMFYGIKFYDVWDWYKAKLPFHEFVAIKQKTISGIRGKIDDVKESVGMETAKDEETDEKKYAVWHVKEFNQAEYKPNKKKAGFPEQAGLVVKKENTESKFEAIKPTQTEEIEKEKVEAVMEEKHSSSDTNKSDVKVEEKQPDKANMADDLDVSGYYKVLDNQDLEYLDKPIIYKGAATIVGSNSLYIADNFMYLYGIYSDSRIHDLVRAQEYLVKLTENKEATCYVVAYTVQSQTATALCFADGILLNQELVDKYLADNIALK